jgi:hypothetical protein
MPELRFQKPCWAQQPCGKLSTSWEQAVRTYPVDKLLEQHCYKSAAGWNTESLAILTCHNQFGQTLQQMLLSIFSL